MSKHKFSAEELNFIKLFDGDTDATAHKCGISCRDAATLLRRVDIRDAIRGRELTENAALQRLAVATRQELQEFWSKIMRDDLKTKNGSPVVVDIDTRVKASDLLAKSQGAFTSNLVHTGKDGGPIVSATVHVNSRDLAERTQLLLAKKVKADLTCLNA